jgi:hypothetical protein
VGNIEVVGFNTNPINDAGTEFITWTSAVKDFAYEVGEIIAVPAMWKTTVGSTEFAGLPDAVLFTPEEADGTDPELVEGAENILNGTLFTITFTEVQYRGGTGIFKGKVNLRLPVEIDYESDGNVDWVAQLGTNVDVTNTALVDTGDFLNVWVVDPKAGDLVSGTVEIRAAPETSVTVNQVEFYVNGSWIGTDTNGDDGWSYSWITTGYDNGDYALAVVARADTLVATSSPVTVTVNNSGQPPPPPAPTVTLTADPLTVVEGESSTLSWISTSATSCTGSWTTEILGTEGSDTVNPTETTTYTITCTGEGGTADDSVTVTVEPLPSGITFSGSSATGPRGTWMATVSVTNGTPGQTISGAWNIGGTPNGCTINNDGWCTFTRTGIRNNIQSVTWTYSDSQGVTILRP